MDSDEFNKGYYMGFTNSPDARFGASLRRQLDQDEARREADRQARLIHGSGLSRPLVTEPIT